MFKSAANKITHNTLITAITGHGESKFLHELIVAEKAVLTSIQRLSADLQKSAEALKAWGLNEAGDLGDVLSGSLELLSLFSSALSRYATHEHTVREHMKAIRSREEQFFKLQRFQQSMVDKDELTAKKLEKLRAEDIALHEMSQEHARLRQLREAMQVSEAKIRTDGAELRNFKRKATKRWMLIKFGGLVEFSEVGTIVGQIGKLLVAELPDMQPGQGQKAYAGYATVEALVRKAQRRVNKVKYSPHPMPSFLSQDPSSSGNKATAPHPQPPTNSNQTGGPSTGETSWISKLVLPRLHIDAEKQNDSRQTQALSIYSPDAKTHGTSQSDEKDNTPSHSPVAPSPTVGAHGAQPELTAQSRKQMREYLAGGPAYGASAPPHPLHRVSFPQPGPGSSLPSYMRGSWDPSSAGVDLSVPEDVRVSILTPPPTYELSSEPELSEPSGPSMGMQDLPNPLTFPNPGPLHLYNNAAASLAPPPDQDALSDSSSTLLPYLCTDVTEPAAGVTRGKRVRFCEVDDVCEFMSLSPEPEGDEMSPIEQSESIESSSTDEH